MKHIFALLLALAPVTLLAQDVDPASPKTIADAIQAEGYRAQLDFDDTGDPLIRSKIEGINYSLFFYGCDEGKDCKRILFSAAFTLDTPMTIESLNNWNTHKLFGRAYLDDDGDSVLDYIVDMPFGMDQRSFAEVLDWWGVAVSDFKDFIDF